MSSSSSTHSSSRRVRYVEAKRSKNTDSGTGMSEMVVIRAMKNPPPNLSLVDKAEEHDMIKSVLWKINEITKKSTELQNSLEILEGYYKVYSQGFAERITLADQNSIWALNFEHGWTFIKDIYIEDTRRLVVEINTLEARPMTKELDIPGIGYYSPPNDTRASGRSSHRLNGFNNHHHRHTNSSSSSSSSSSAFSSAHLRQQLEEYGLDEDDIDDDGDTAISFQESRTAAAASALEPSAKKRKRSSSTMNVGSTLDAPVLTMMSASRNVVASGSRKTPAFGNTNSYPINGDERNAPGFFTTIANAFMGDVDDDDEETIDDE